MGYGAPLCESPVLLGDGYGTSFGASVLVRDFKYISFSIQADGTAMRNPASFGMGNFIQASDDSIKTVTSVEDVMWKMLATTVFGGFVNYGSVACPCCFGPTSHYQPPASCKEILIQDLLLPIVKLKQTFDDGYKNNVLVLPPDHEEMVRKEVGKG